MPSIPCPQKSRHQDPSKCWMLVEVMHSKIITDAVKISNTLCMVGIGNVQVQTFPHWLLSW